MKPIKQKCNATLKKIAWLYLILLLGSTSTFCQENNPNKPSPDYEKEWWFPITQKHNIDLKNFTAINNLKAGMINSLKYSVVEMGNNGRINGRTMTLDKIICIYRENDKEYNFVTAESATHDIDMKQVTCMNGKIEVFSLESKDLKPKISTIFEKLQIDFETNKAIVTNPKKIDK